MAEHRTGECRRTGGGAVVAYALRAGPAVRVERIERVAVLVAARENDMTVVRILNNLKCLAEGKLVVSNRN